MSGTPDFERVRKMLLLQGEPDRVPIMEQTVDRDVKKAFLGRPIRGLEDDVEFWISAGYDYVPLPCGIRTALLATNRDERSEIAGQDLSRSMRSMKAKYSVIEDEERERSWAEEGTGIIAGQAEFGAFRWPEAGAMDYSDLERVGDYLPAGAKAIASIGYIYATVTRLMGFRNFCEKLIEEPDLVARIFDRVGRIQLQVFETVVRMDVVGGTWQPDDVAYVTGTMVAPGFLRKHLWPWYREMGRISRGLEPVMNLR